MILRAFDDMIDSFILSLSRRPLLVYALVLLVTLILFLFGLFDMPPMDRDETRFAQATKQMLETNNFIDIRLGEEVRYKKPVGIYWLQAISVSLFGSADSLNEIGYYRIPSVLGGLIAIFATIAMTRRLFGREAAVIAGLLSPIPLLVSVEAHLAKTDSVLVACTALGLYSLSCLWRLNEIDTAFKFKFRHFLIFWLALSVGILVKGVNVFVILSTIITLCIVQKDVKWLAPLKPQLGLFIVCAVVLPWFLMIQKISGGQFLNDSAGTDFYTKLISGVESHGALPLTHLLVHFGVFWPLSLLSPFAIIVMWQNRKINGGYLFILSSIIPTWIVFEIVPTKLPHYTYPLYSLLIAGISNVILGFVRDNYDILKGKLSLVISVIYFCISCIIAILLPFALYHYQGIFDILTICLSLASIVIALCVINSVRTGLLYGVIGFLILQSLFVLPNGFARVMPRLEVLNLATQMNNAIDNSDCSRNAVFVSGYTEPSVMFKIGTQVKFASTENLMEKFKSATPCTLFFVGEKNDLFQAEFPNIKPLQTFNGIQINGGDIVKIYLYKR